MTACRHLHSARVVHDRNFVPPGRHRHPHHELVYVVQGGYGGVGGDEPLDLADGQGVLFPAGVDHGCLDRRLGQQVFLILQWEGDPIPTAVLRFTDVGDRIGHPLTRLIALAEVPGEAPARFRDHLTSVIVQEALWLSGSDPCLDQAPDPITRVRQHIERAYTAELDLDHLCTIAGTSRSTLTRRFRRRYGISPIRFLRECRLHHARRLLVTTNLGMAAIAERVGVANAGHLGRMLKQATGRDARALRIRG